MSKRLRNRFEDGTSHMGYSWLTRVLDCLEEQAVSTVGVAGRSHHWASHLGLAYSAGTLTSYVVQRGRKGYFAVNRPRACPSPWVTPHPVCRRRLERARVGWVRATRTGRAASQTSGLIGNGRYPLFSFSFWKAEMVTLKRG